MGLLFHSQISGPILASSQPPAPGGLKAGKERGARSREEAVKRKEEEKREEMAEQGKEG